MKNLGKLIGSTGVVISDGVVATPVNFTIHGWGHSTLRNGDDTIEIVWWSDSRAYHIEKLQRNGKDVEHGEWIHEEAHPDVPSWAEHLQTGMSGLCDLAWAARNQAIKNLVEAAGMEYDEEDGPYGYGLDDEGNLVSTDDEG